jgi:DNA-directed RNA polymerase alpha subunit
MAAGKSGPMKAAAPAAAPSKPMGAGKSGPIAKAPAPAPAPAKPAEPEAPVMSAKSVAAAAKYPNPRDIPIEILDISSATFDALEAANVTTLGDLAARSEKELAKVGVAKKSIGEIKSLVAAHGLALRNT